jgi:hypothetical protein
MNGSDQWEGLVLVGEHLISNGNNRVYGATYTGLDVLLEDPADWQQWMDDLGQQTVGNGNKTFQYDSCTIAQALDRFGGFAVLDRTWMDNWPAS